MSSAEPSEPNVEQLAEEFTADMYDGYHYLVRKIKYNAKAFLSMVTMHGGVGAAQMLLRGRDASDGFTTLWENNELGHSVEAYVLHPKYARLFSADERATARRRLEEHRFDVDSYLRQLALGP